MNSRTLALASALVVLVAAAIGAQSASAAQFHSEAEPTSLEVFSTSNHVIKTTAFEFRCEAASFSGTQSSKTAEVMTVSSIYSFCRGYAFGASFTVGINSNGCHHGLGANGSYTMACPAGFGFKLLISGCTLTIPSQTVSGMSYANSGKRVNVTWNVTGLSYSHTGFICGTGSASDGTYTGSAVAIGKNSKSEEIKYWWE